MILQKPRDLMEDWIPHQSDFLFEILALEAPPSDLKCTHCPTEISALRCIECFGSPLLCNSCCIKTHIANPYHKIEAWNGRCFMPSDLHDIGMTLHLGHGGAPCPHTVADDLSDATNRQNSSSNTEEDVNWEDCDVQDVVMTIVHTNGVYKRRIQWCKCPNAAIHYVQLLRMRLYPATVQRPQTSFTFDVLDHFYIDSMECKTSANNFYSKLRRLTSNAFPHTVPVAHGIELRCNKTLTLLCRTGIVNCYGSQGNGGSCSLKKDLDMDMMFSQFQGKETWLYFVLLVLNLD